MPVFTIKTIALFIIDGSFVFRPALFIEQPLFATYALKWKDYFLTLILIRYLGCFVPVVCHFALWENLSRFSINKNPASRNINTGKAN